MALRRKGSVDVPSVSRGAIGAPTVTVAVPGQHDRGTVERGKRGNGGIMAMPLFTARRQVGRRVVGDHRLGRAGALTHVRDRDDAAARLREAIALALDIPQDSFNVQVDFDVAGPPSLQLEGMYRTKSRGRQDRWKMGDAGRRMNEWILRHPSGYGAARGRPRNGKDSPGRWSPSRGGWRRRRLV